MTQLSALLPFGLLCALAGAQSVATFPDNYTTIAEGPLNSPNLPLARGASRVMCLYETVDLVIPSGHNITKIGFRQDGTLTTLDTGRQLQLEVRMGWSTQTAANMSTTFANNYASTPVTVFGPAIFTLPNLRDPAAPLTNGQFFLDLTTPFPYVPAGNNLVVEYLVTGTSGGSAQFNYRLDRADFVSPIVYGQAGCPHSGNNTTNLSTTGMRPGQAVTMSVTTAPANSFGLLLVSPGQQLVPAFSLQALVPGIQPTCTGQLPLNGLLTLSGVSSSSGSKSWTWTVPNNAVWNGYYWSAQAAFFDFFSPGGIVTSRGAQLQVGTLPRCSIVAASGPPAGLTTGSASRNYCPVTFFEHQ